MENTFTENYKEHIDFSYRCFDRIILRGYIPFLFMDGSVINLLKNLGYKKHSGLLDRLPLATSNEKPR